MTTVNLEAKRMAGQPQLAESPKTVWENGSDGHLNLTSPVQCQALGLPPQPGSTRVLDRDVNSSLDSAPSLNQNPCNQLQR